MMQLSKAAALFGFSFNDKKSHQLHEKFQAHMSYQGLSYGTKEEYHYRFELFAEKEKEIQEWNNKQDSFRLAHNMFSTKTKEEASKLLGAGKIDLPIVEPAHFDESNLKDSLDWRAQGAVNAVKNQAQCGSCWAFGATAVTETAHWKSTGKLLSLSEQQLVSCESKSHGCNGGVQLWALQYLESNPQTLETSYPYTSGHGDSGVCDTAMAGTGTVQVTGTTWVPRNSVSQLKAAINTGVVTVTIEADQSVFQMYHSGILDTTACGTQLDHAVAAVGYGTEGGKDYYIVRNSWGASWGDQGYIKIAAVDGEGICGIQMQSFTATTN